MPKLTIDGLEIEVEPGTSVLEASKKLGIEIPHFCYHDRLSVPANCRMCLVDIENGPLKPLPACATICGEGMIVHTDTKRVKEARHGVMEFILINHPLDCPVCDQGGECDLQDQAYGYGFDRSRFHEPKRIVKDKELGPLVKTIMTRCINCTRCIRFAEEIANVQDLGQLNRGEKAEIGTFIQKTFNSELSGNLVDICPVGALTAKPYAYKVRAWELTHTNAIDVHDAIGSNIRIDSRANEIIRILPRVHEEINQEWIADKTRFAHDGLLKNRLDRPWIRKRKNAKLEEVSWDEALSFIKQKIKNIEPSQIAALAGDLCDLESLVALKDLCTQIGTQNTECRTDGAKFDPTKRYGYLFNSGITALDQADALIFVGANPKHDAAVLMARINKSKAPICSINNTKELKSLLSEEHPFSKTLKKAEKPLVIAGMNAFKNVEGNKVHALCGAVSDHYNAPFNMLHSAASRVGALEVGFVSKNEIILENMALIYLLNMDEFDVRERAGKKPFIIYQGHHGDINATKADVVLPGSAYTEKESIYVNTEGRPQKTNKAVEPPEKAKEDWKIIKAIADIIDFTLPYTSLLELRERIEKEWPHLVAFNSIKGTRKSVFGLKGDVKNIDFLSPDLNYYQTNSISRSSETMAKCVKAFVTSKENNKQKSRRKKS